MAHLAVVIGQYFRDAAKFLDRKSTRLNSSHSQISYAVFCLKKNTVNAVLTLSTIPTPSDDTQVQSSSTAASQRFPSTSCMRLITTQSVPVPVTGMYTLYDPP